MESTVRRDTLVCRKAETADRSFMVDLAGESFADFGDYAAIIDQWLDVSRTQSFVLMDGAGKVGFSLLARERSLGFWRPVTAELVAIVLERRSRRQGLGRYLLGVSEAQARQWRASEIRLHTAQSNTSAQAFFREAGYRVYDGHTAHYPNGEAAVAMRRDLEPSRTGPRRWHHRTRASSSR